MITFKYGNLYAENTQNNHIILEELEKFYCISLKMCISYNIVLIKKYYILWDVLRETLHLL